MHDARRAEVVGTGLIGGSIGLALRAQGWHVTGSDRDQARARRAVELGALDAVGTDPEASIVFVATPVGAVTAAAREALGRSRAVVTDVGSAKASVVGGVADRRFVGGHPMAGSEQEGVDGAAADLFQGAVWVLTPTEETDESAYLDVRSVVSSFGAEVVALSPAHHDALVALVSHGPHLTAATLVHLAGSEAEDHRAVLRLAAGGFRDMTRVAAGHPGIWPDICVANRDAIVAVLDDLVRELGAVRALVAEGDRSALLTYLETASQARRNLPTGLPVAEHLAVVRIPVPDRPGTIAEVTTLATDLDLNILDLEIAHSAEGGKGVLILVVAADRAPALVDGLAARGYRSSLRSLE